MLRNQMRLENNRIEWETLEVGMMIRSYFQHWGNHFRLPTGNSSIAETLPPADEDDADGDCIAASASPAFQTTNVATICVYADDFQLEVLPRSPR